MNFLGFGMGVLLYYMLVLGYGFVVYVYYFLLLLNRFFLRMFFFDFFLYCVKVGVMIMLINGMRRFFIVYFNVIIL